jgi:hypothetical protein
MAGFNAKAIEIALDELLALGTPKLAFMATSFTHDQEAQQYWSDISSSIASGTTLRTLTNVATNIDTTNNRVEIDFDNPSETPVTTTTNQVCLIVDTGTPSTTPVVACGNLAQTYNPVAGTLTLTLSAEGLGAINY